VNPKAAEHADRLRKSWAGPMSQQEIEFLRDVQGFIEFAIRNGLSFPMVVGGICHDVNAIAQHAFDLNATKATGFLPKTTGYSKLMAEDFGESEEPAAS
jgi:hypothetical protein